MRPLAAAGRVGAGVRPVAEVGRGGGVRVPIEPYESGAALPMNAVDAPVLEALRARGIQPAFACSDVVFFRRLYLDVIGTLPSAAELVAFVQDKSPFKRAAWIETVLARPEFADYWAMKWCDLLRVKAEFPVNLWPNAVQAYHRWLLDSIWANVPYDEFARALLTSSGSNFRVPPVNFYRALQGRDPQAIAEAVALTFLGARLARWPAALREGFAKFFSRLAYKPTGEWKEEIVMLDPAPAGRLEATFPDGTTAVIPDGADPREVFADWLISPANPWFAKNIVNRVWSWLMGRGITHEPDDIRDDNPPSNPALLAVLEQELIAAKWDLKQLYRLILNSRTYQQSSLPRTDDPAGEALFAWYPVRQLDAEILADAFYWLTNDGDSYSSNIPEPFTFIPKEQRTIALADGSITSPFLEMFGRPARDTGLESERTRTPTAAQRLHLLNSSDIQLRLDRSPRLRRIQSEMGSNRGKLITWLYATILTRAPMPDELATAETYFQTGGVGLSQAVVDLSWALINSKEFLYRH